jgi:hypothetical protein
LAGSLLRSQMGKYGTETIKTGGTESHKRKALNCKSLAWSLFQHNIDVFQLRNNFTTIAVGVVKTYQ